MKIIFSNEGEIDQRAFSSFGINVKENENPIGFFGTGLKYALAVLLREGCSIKVLSGTQLIEFYTRRATFRNKEFDFVHMHIDGGAAIELGFTTELGRNWEMWGAYREIACNCMDEKGDAYESVADSVPDEGMTYFIVEGESFVMEHIKRGETILEREPMFSFGDVDFYNHTGTKCYYRCVRAHDMNLAGMFTYNVRSELELTEDRTLKDPASFFYKVAKMILSEVEDEKFLEKVLLAENKFQEHHFDYHGWSNHQPTSAFLNTVCRLMNDKAMQINPTAVRVWKDATKNDIAPTPVVLSKVQQNMLEKAIIFCCKFGFIVDEYPISCVAALGENCLGLADNGTIYIAERVFHQGTKQLASTLIEEYLHLKHNYRDFTRELQTYLFDRIISMGEELQGEAL